MQASVSPGTQSINLPLAEHARKPSKPIANVSSPTKPPNAWTLVERGSDPDPAYATVHDTGQSSDLLLLKKAHGRFTPNPRCDLPTSVDDLPMLMILRFL
jgi:hypothetical protein